MALPKVSVVIPVYGYSKYLSESIESALNQTLKDIEVIVVEDAKNGRFENEETMEKYEHDVRVIHIKNENKEGFANSLNKGFSIAKADYIARLDADDISLPDRLLLQYNFLIEKGAQISIRLWLTGTLW